MAFSKQKVYHYNSPIETSLFVCKLYKNHNYTRQVDLLESQITIETLLSYSEFLNMEMFVVHLNNKLS